MGNRELIDRLRARGRDHICEVAADALERAEAELASMGAREERERMCHAGCGVIAGCDTEESLAAATAGIHPDYQSAAVSAIAATMRKLIDTRAELAKYRSAPTYRVEYVGPQENGRHHVELIIRPEAP